MALQLNSKSMPLPSAFLSRTLRVFQICSPTTDAGKTIFTTLLTLTHHRLYPHEKVHFLKPISMGLSQSADSAHLSRYTKHALDSCKTLFQYPEPKSPHLVGSSSEVPPDDKVQREIWNHLISLNTSSSLPPTSGATLFLETAGGVNSPSFSGISQADLYRPFGLPVVLIADSGLGGISTTISAFESLKVRGYVVDAVMIFEDEYYQNYAYLKEYFDREWGIKTAVVERPPPFPIVPSPNNLEKDEDSMNRYYTENSIEEGQTAMILKEIRDRHESKIERLQSLASIARDKIWYPFTQQQGMQPTDIITIDSAYGDHFQTLRSNSNDLLLTPMFDASASWWTQGLGHGNPKLSLTAAYAAGRYGHIIFAGTAHEPSIALAELMLSSLNNPRLTRAFYSDNGSTGCEVAVKMALKASRKRYEWDKDGKEIRVLGLKGAYHGDTIGAMDCANPGTFNREVDWYKGRGYWFECPTIGCKHGKWKITLPKEIQHASNSREELVFDDINDIFNLNLRKKERFSSSSSSSSSSSLAEIYRSHILSTLQSLLSSGHRFGALIIEPVVLGAGGMLLVDPLFQHILCTTIRANSSLFSSSSSSSSSSSDTACWTGLPIISDEVFTGLYRLNEFSSSSLIQVHPDISIHAKLLTGGLLPLSITLSSESIFQSFLSSAKKDALLHGHSYTAHPVGCEVSRASIQTLKSLYLRSFGKAKEDWVGQESQEILQSSSSSTPLHSPSPKVWSVFSKSFLNEVSHQQNVSWTWTLGTIFAARLEATDNKGYSSDTAKRFLLKLKEGICITQSEGEAEGYFKLHARALGDVVYVMTGHMTSQEEVTKLQEAILRAL